MTITRAEFARKLAGRKEATLRERVRHEVELQRARDHDRRMASAYRQDRIIGDAWVEAMFTS